MEQYIGSPAAEAQQKVCKCRTVQNQVNDSFRAVTCSYQSNELATPCQARPGQDSPVRGRWQCRHLQVSMQCWISLGPVHEQSARDQ